MSEWNNLTADEKKRKLFEKQKKLLEDFLAKGAITKAQYDKSLGCMAEKMGFSIDNS